MKFSLNVLAGAMAIVNASPLASSTAAASSSSIPVGNLPASAGGGALDPTPVHVNIKGPVPTAPASITIKLVNKAGVAISTSANHNVGSAGFATDNPGTGTLADGATATRVAPTGWAGAIAFNRFDRAIKGDEGIFEGSFTIQKDVNDTIAVLDIDVSFVNGFTMPIMCYCGADDKGTYLSGCSIDLWQKNTCPAEYDNGAGSCKNPRREQKVNRTAIPFLQPCAGLGYTFVEDHAANSNVECQTGTITCDILPGFKA
jgi:hypothetical protein